MRPTQKQKTTSGMLGRYEAKPALIDHHGASIYTMIDGYRARTTVWVNGQMVSADIHHNPNWCHVRAVDRYGYNDEPMVEYPEPDVIEQEPVRHRSLWSHPPLTGLIRVTVVDPPWSNWSPTHKAPWYDVTIGDKDPRTFTAMVASSNPFVLTLAKEIV